MSQTTEQYKQKAIEAVQEYKNKLLEEFLLKATELNEKLSNLLATGVDNKNYICIEGIEIYRDISYTVISKKMVINLKTVLKSMLDNKEKSVEIFDNVDKDSRLKFNDYQEFVDMEDLSISLNDARCAENILQ